MDKESAHELTILARFPTEMEASLLVAELEANNITVSMTGGFTAGFIAEAPGDVQVKIFQRDREHAEKVLHAFKTANENIDWSQVDVGDTKEK